MVQGRQVHTQGREGGGLTGGSYLWSCQAQQAAATSTVAAVGRRLARRPPIGAPTGGLRALCRASNQRGAVCNITCGLSLYLRSSRLMLSRQLLLVYDAAGGTAAREVNFANDNPSQGWVITAQGVGQRATGGIMKERHIKTCPE